MTDESRSRWRWVIALLIDSPLRRRVRLDASIEGGRRVSDSAAKASMLKSVMMRRPPSRRRGQSRHSIRSTRVSATPKIPSPSSGGISSDDDIMRMALARLQAWRIGVSSSFRPLEIISIFRLAFFFMTAPPRCSRWWPQNPQSGGLCSPCGHRTSTRPAPRCLEGRPALRGYREAWWPVPRGARRAR
jgi:hypothetical protein